jgi:hypothetical protein
MSHSATLATKAAELIHDHPGAWNTHDLARLLNASPAEMEWALYRRGRALCVGLQLSGLWHPRDPADPGASGPPCPEPEYPDPFHPTAAIIAAHEHNHGTPEPWTREQWQLVAEGLTGLASLLKGLCDHRTATAYAKLGNDAWQHAESARPEQL